MQELQIYVSVFWSNECSKDKITCGNDEIITRSEKKTQKINKWKEKKTRKAASEKNNNAEKYVHNISNMYKVTKSI